MIASLESYIEEHKEKFIKELIELLRFPSISSLSDHKADMVNNAEWLKHHMESIGLNNCAVYPTNGHPVVYGEWLGAEGKPIILIYGHYDVQPVDPIDLWDSPPFEPVIKGDHIYARGAADDKGQFFTHLKSLEAQLRINGRLPVNVKVILEGEEEIGSPSLKPFMLEHSELLANDLITISDSPLYDYNMPTICYGLRGLSYMEIKLKGPSKDLHSGSFGGVVANPIEVLTKIVAQLKDDKGRITITGFYDKVLPPTEEERENFSRIPFDKDKYLTEIGSPALSGEEGFSTVERAWVRPTLDPNGIVGGYIGEGAKTVIPAEASCKISMRLVPNQDSDEISELFEDYVKRICPPTVKLEITRHHGGKPYLLPLDNPVIKLAARALERGFGNPPFFTREGGSIPIVATFQEVLGSDTLLLPLGLPDENCHSPNENFYLPNFFAGIKTSAYLLEELSADSGK